MTLPEFQRFDKISRLESPISITEKIDGTNAIIYISEDNQVVAGSRNKWLTPGDDNFGFAKWVSQHTEELLTLGVGYHYGEWWGAGIQRGYGLQERRFSLFDVFKWNKDNKPSCCSVVPLLYEGNFDMNKIFFLLGKLRIDGSIAAMGYSDPEGLVIRFQHNNTLFKIFC